MNYFPGDESIARFPFLSIIGTDSTLDRSCVLTEPHNVCLLRCLAQDGYQIK